MSAQQQGRIAFIPETEQSIPETELSIPETGGHITLLLIPLK